MAAEALEAASKAAVAASKAAVAASKAAVAAASKAEVATVAVVARVVATLARCRPGSTLKTVSSRVRAPDGPRAEARAEARATAAVARARASPVDRAGVRGGGFYHAGPIKMHTHMPHTPQAKRRRGTEPGTFALFTLTHALPQAKVRVVVRPPSA